MDLKLDPITKDMVWENGGCPATRESAEVLAQRLLIRFRTFLGEWFLNVDYGVPYLERILGKKVKKSVVDAIMQEQIYKDNRVAQIISFTSTLHPQTRRYSCSFRVRSITGTTTETITVP